MHVAKLTWCFQQSPHWPLTYIPEAVAPLVADYLVPTCPAWCRYRSGSSDHLRMIYKHTSSAIGGTCKNTQGRATKATSIIAAVKPIVLCFRGEGRGSGVSASRLLSVVRANVLFLTWQRYTTKKINTQQNHNKAEDSHHGYTCTTTQTFLANIASLSFERERVQLCILRKRKQVAQRTICCEMWRILINFTISLNLSVF